MLPNGFHNYYNVLPLSETNYPGFRYSAPAYRSGHFHPAPKIPSRTPFYATRFATRKNKTLENSRVLKRRRPDLNRWILVLQTTPLYAKKSHIYRHCSHFSNRRPPYAPPYFSCHYCTPESDLFQTLYPTYMEETWNIN